MGITFTLPVLNICSVLYKTITVVAVVQVEFVQSLARHVGSLHENTGK